MYMYIVCGHVHATVCVCVCVCRWLCDYVSQGAQINPTIMAVALPREVIEIEIPDTAGLDSVPYGDDMPDSASMGPSGSLAKRRLGIK